MAEYADDSAIDSAARFGRSGLNSQLAIVLTPLSRRCGRSSGVGGFLVAGQADEPLLTSGGLHYESLGVAVEPPVEEEVDDGSDATVVDGSLTAWARREPDLVRILRQPNRGVCVARNHMIDAMSADSFLLVDQDDVLEPDFLRRTGEAMRQDASLWAVAVWTDFFGEYKGIEAKPPFDRRVGLRENPIVSTAALVDIRVRDEGIKFEPDLAFLYCEDWHYWSQIIAAGGRMGLVPEPLIRHRVHHASGGFQRTEVAHRMRKARAVEPLLRCAPPG